jgi:hypothetical protein
MYPGKSWVSLSTGRDAQDLPGYVVGGLGRNGPNLIFLKPQIKKPVSPKGHRNAGFRFAQRQTTS